MSPKLNPLIPVAAFKIQWLKSRANAARFSEELILLEEEMRRVIEFAHWRARWWQNLGGARETNNAQLAEGLRAYAEEQAHVERLRALRLTNRWFLPRERATTILLSLNNPDQVSKLDSLNLAEVVVELDEDHEDEEMLSDGVGD